MAGQLHTRTCLQSVPRSKLHHASLCQSTQACSCSVSWLKDVEGGLEASGAADLGRRKLQRRRRAMLGAT